MSRRYSHGVTDDPSPGTSPISRSAVLATVGLAVAVLAMAVLWQASTPGEETGADPSAPEAAAAPAVETGIVRAGVAAPDFTLTSLEGETISLDDYAGRPVVVNFWASWCPPCREEFPVLAAAREAHAGSGLEILGITRNDGAEYSRAFAEDSGAAWPILPDPDGSAWEAYDGVGLPTSFFIDGDGIVQRVHIGPVDEAQLADHLAAIGVG